MNGWRKSWRWWARQSSGSGAINLAELTFRRACQDDLPSIIAMLADDVLGSTRESQSDGEPGQAYLDAFAEIDADPNQMLCVAEADGAQVGTLQLSIIPGLARGGAKRGQIEAVRIASHRRGEQIGEAMFIWAIDQCRQRGCRLVQLTTDKARPDAHRFYDRLGFEATHVGYKLSL
jgi:GNAT superfamily N-acetyltransferase